MLSPSMFRSYSQEGTETHFAKDTEAAKLCKEKLRNARTEITFKLEVQPPFV